MHRAEVIAINLLIFISGRVTGSVISLAQRIKVSGSDGVVETTRDEIYMDATTRRLYEVAIQAARHANLASTKRTTTNLPRKIVALTRKGPILAVSLGPTFSKACMLVPSRA